MLQLPGVSILDPGCRKFCKTAGISRPPLGSKLLLQTPLLPRLRVRQELPGRAFPADVIVGKGQHGMGGWQQHLVRAELPRGEEFSEPFRQQLGGNVRIHRSVSVWVRRRGYHDFDPGRAKGRHRRQSSPACPLAKELLSQRHKHGRIAGEGQLGLVGTQGELQLRVALVDKT